jgi:hypothetical protein
MAKSFPCWVCKGEGTWVEPVLDYGQGPTESCNYCNGEGMIEIGGKRHREIVAESIGLKAINFLKPTKEEWTWDELKAIGEAALKAAEITT